VIYPSYTFLLEMHEFLMRDVWHETYYGPHRPELLQSALGRPLNAACYESADGIRQAAYLFHGLLMNHGFVQGNKRTAYAMLEWFLNINALGPISATDEAIVEFCLGAENDKWSIEKLENWIRENVSGVGRDPTPPPTSN
jgi:death-on-curing protein